MLYKNKSFKYTLLILCLAIFFFGLLTGRPAFINSAHEIIPHTDKGFEKDPKGIYAELSPGLMEQNTIKLWWNDDLLCYDLFLPSYADDDMGISFYIPGDPGYKNITVDDGSVSIFKVKDLLSKDHIINITDTDINSHPLKTHRSSSLPALFLEIDRYSAENLCIPPYAEYYGGITKLIDPYGNLVLRENIDNLRVRGNTSADWIKKPFQLTLSYPGDLLGTGAARRWNLLSNRSDGTYIRNKLTYDLAADAGLPFSPESGFADLYINGEYYGNYQISEKVEVENDRVAIRNLSELTRIHFSEKDEEVLNWPDDAVTETPLKTEDYRIEDLPSGMRIRYWDGELLTSDITGGYLLEIERPSRIWESPGFFITTRGQPVTIRSPKYPTRDEVLAISDYWQQFEDAVFSEDGINPITGLHYSAYADMESLAGKYLVEEIVRNYDASSTSQYFYKDSQDILRAGPVWDYDMSLGNPIMNPGTNQNYISSVSPHGLYASVYMDDYTLWAALNAHDDFRLLVKNLYMERFLPILDDIEANRIDLLNSYLRDSALMDTYRYDASEGMEGAVSEYEKDIYILKSFVSERKKYLSGLWIDNRESVKVYLSAGDADLYVSYVENLSGEPLLPPPPPEWEGYEFLHWTNGYLEDGEPYDFSVPYNGEPLYLAAVFRSEDGSLIICRI